MQWADQSPDFRRLPAEQLFTSLTLMQVVDVLSLSRTQDAVLVDGHTWKQIQAHLKSKTFELGGLLLGQVFGQLWDNERWVAFIRAAVPAEDYDATGVSLRMNSHVWEKARGLAGIENLTVIGWYHSHPNLGVFFSGTDRRTQRSFFREGHSLGLVVDPFQDQRKWFYGPSADELSEQQVRILSDYSSSTVLRADVGGMLQLPE